MVIGGVQGIVIDENNQPVEGASVTSGSSTTTTNRYGVFFFNNINLSIRLSFTTPIVHSDITPSVIVRWENEKLQKATTKSL